MSRKVGGHVHSHLRGVEKQVDAGATLHRIPGGRASAQSGLRKIPPKHRYYDKSKQSVLGSRIFVCNNDNASGDRWNVRVTSRAGRNKNMCGTQQ
jgi:hypothetical protein